MKYADDERLGLTWAGTTTLREAYEWDPRALFEVGLDPGGSPRRGGLYLH